MKQSKANEAKRRHTRSVGRVTPIAATTELYVSLSFSSLVATAASSATIRFSSAWTAPERAKSGATAGCDSASPTFRFLLGGPVVAVSRRGGSRGREEGAWLVVCAPLPSSRLVNEGKRQPVSKVFATGVSSSQSSRQGRVGK